MNYTEKDYAELFEEVLQDSLEKGLISHAEEFPSYIENQEDISNYYVMDKSVLALFGERIYQEAITPVYESAKVEYAENDDLDENIGDVVGIPRPEATYAYVDVTFTLDVVLEEDVNISQEVVLSTDTGIEYRTLENIFIPAGETSATVSCMAVEPGVASKIVENTLVNIETELEINFSCNNDKASTGGTEEYTDDEYRYLLMHWKEVNLKGSADAYEEYFANFDGIDSYKIVPCWDGTGTIKVILDPGTPEQLLRAYNDLQSKVTQAKEDITMFAPVSKPIDIYAVVNVDIDQLNPYSDVEKEKIKARIISSIKVFIDGGYTTDDTYYPGLLLGEDFIPHKLAVFLDDEIPELKNITFNYPLNYITILDEEIGVSNDITIEMI